LKNLLEASWKVPCYVDTIYQEAEMVQNGVA